MRFSFTGKNIGVSDFLKEKAEQKIGRLSRVLPDDCEVFVTFSSERLTQKVEVTVPVGKRVLRAESSTPDMLVSIDNVCAALDRQMVKYKQRLKSRTRKDSSAKAELGFAFPEMRVDEGETDEPEIVIKKTKRVSLKPMDPEEAVMQMEMLGHDFFVFRNGVTDEVNVVYRRNDNAYGLIEGNE